MLKINLLGKKKRYKFGLFEPFVEKLGLQQISEDELSKLKLIALKIFVFVFFWQLVTFVPNYYLEQEKAKLNAQIQIKEKKIKRLQAELRSKKEIRTKGKQLAQQIKETKQKIEVLNGLEKERYQAFKVMDTISVLIPERVWINRIEYEKKKVKLEGSAWEYVPINQFVKSMAEAATFSAVTLNNVRAELVKKLVPGVAEALQKLKNYQIDINVKQSVEE